MDITYINILIDRSGSMNRIREEAEGGLRTFFEDQKKNTPDDQKVITKLSQFDNQYEIVWDNKDINDNTEYHLEPRGMTALLDAIGRMSGEIEDTIRNSSADEKPSKVILVVLTDGQENCSKEWSYNQVKQLLEEKQDKNNWEVLFLGANMDAAKEGQRIGLRSHSTMTYSATGDGVTGAFAAASRSVTRARNNEEYDLSAEE